MTTQQSAISVRGVSKSFGASDTTVQVLHEVTVEIVTRESFNLLGLRQSNTSATHRCVRRRQRRQYPDRRGAG